MADPTATIPYQVQVPFPRSVLTTPDGYSPATVVFWAASEEWTEHGPKPSKLRHLVATTTSQIVGRVIAIPPEERTDFLFWWEIPGWCEGYAESLEDAKEALVVALREQFEMVTAIED